MNRRHTSLLATLCLGALAACSGDVVQPTSLDVPRAAVNAPVIGDGTGNFLVLLKNSNSAKAVAAKVEALGGTVTYMHEGAGIATVAGLSDAAATQLAANSAVQEVKANRVVSLVAPAEVTAAMPEISIESQSAPQTAVLFSWQWNMQAINAPAAWAAGKLGSPNVTVAIIDSGLDYDNRDLTGLVDLSRSASFVASDDSLASARFPTRNKIVDFNGHGTNVGATVSSKAFAFAGVTSRTTLIGVKAVGRTGSGPLGNILLGILWAADHNANIANMSLGAAFSKAGAQGLGGFLNRVINYANKQNMLIVAAAGNDTADLDHDGNTYSTWCSAPHVVCVSAVGPQTPTGSFDVPATFTNFGRSAISVAAPGGNDSPVVSTWPWGNTNFSAVWSFCARQKVTGFSSTGVPTTPCSGGGTVSGQAGTSQASPHVAGLAALLMAEYPSLSMGEIKAKILDSADDLGPTGVDPYYGRGRINVAKALGL
ncbi:MAG TPA: S8 family serine peptidase [Gemmatimonadaceae bacterium]